MGRIAVTVLCFAALREQVGAAVLTWEGEEGSRLGDLRQGLAEQFPAIAPHLPHCRLAMNQEFVEDSALVPDGAEVALIPPVSGG